MPPTVNDAPQPAAWYALRRTLPTWSFDENLDELVAFLPRYRVDELIVKVDTEEFTHGQPPLEWVEAYVPQLHRVREAVSSIGVRFSLNPWITVGHIDRGRDARKQLPGIRTCVGHDGVVSACCACPLCPVWRANTEAVWTLYAQTRPHVMWVEDDIRTFNHLPVRYGCFCGEHLRRFSEKVNQRVEREQLVEALLRPGDPHPWRTVFLDLQAAVMNETASFLARVVHATSPETRLGLMSSGPRQHCLEGRTWATFASAIADGQPLYSRPPMGNYWEESPRGFYYSHDSIKLTRHCMPAGTVEQTEVENVPFTRYSKSVAVTFLETAISFAYGSHGVTLNLFDHAGTPMEAEPWYGRMLGERKDYFNALADAAQKPGRYRGVRLLFDERASHGKRLRPGADFGDLRADGEAAMSVLEAHGIPTTYDSDERVAVAVGEQLRRVTDEEILILLGSGRGLLLDGPAARTLVERGFGDLIGATSVSPSRVIDSWTGTPRGAEEFFNPAFGGSPRRYMTLTLPNLMLRAAASALDLAAGAEVVSRFVDPDGHRHETGSYAFDNSLGGRVFVFAYDLTQVAGVAFHHPFRAAQLQQAVRWLSHDEPPVLAYGDGVYPLAFRKDYQNGDTLLGLFNLSLDPWTKVRFTVAMRRRPIRILQLAPNGRWLPSDAVCEDERANMIAVTSRGSYPIDAPLFLRLTFE